MLKLIFSIFCSFYIMSLSFGCRGKRLTKPATSDCIAHAAAQHVHARFDAYSGHESGAFLASCVGVVYSNYTLNHTMT